MLLLACDSFKDVVVPDRVQRDLHREHLVPADGALLRRHPDHDVPGLAGVDLEGRRRLPAAPEDEAVPVRVEVVRRVQVGHLRLHTDGKLLEPSAPHGHRQSNLVTLEPPAEPEPAWIDSDQPGMSNV